MCIRLSILKVFNIMFMLLIGVILSTTITVIDSLSCNEGWLEYERTCFNHYSKRVPWSHADQICVLLRQALLATVDNPEINEFVHNNLTRGSDVWLGLSIPDISISSWKWSDGSNISSYDDWNTAEVNSACAVMTYDNSKGYWYTIPCTNMNFYVCEKEMSDSKCNEWLSFETHCYLIIQESTEPNMAAARNCWQYDAYLISINSKPEADFIYSKLDMNKEFWIGLSPLKWVNDVPYQWNNWGDSGPTHNITNGCVYMDATSGKWLSGNCKNSFLATEHHSYICQKDAVIDLFTTPNVTVEGDTSTNSVLGESYTTDFDALNISNTKESSVNSEQLLLTTVVPAVCGGLITAIVIVVVVIVIRRKKRILSSQDAHANEPAIYYNDITKTRDDRRVTTSDTTPTIIRGTNRHVPTKDAHTPSAGDTERNTYEQLSVGPYVNSAQITTGTYASLQ